MSGNYYSEALGMTMREYFISEIKYWSRSIREWSDVIAAGGDTSAAVRARKRAYINKAKAKRNLDELVDGI